MKKLFILLLLILTSCSAPKAEVQEVPTCIPACIPYSSPTPTSTHTPTPTLIPTPTATPTPRLVCPVNCATATPEITPTPESGGALPIIPGAFGLGMDTVAGSGRNINASNTTIFKVTNLNASGSGSLAACTGASGPRVCIFEVSGTIQTAREVKISNPYITIAGQTAPSPGITIRGAGLRITTHDVLVQHIRIRVGDASNGPDPDNRDGIGIEGQSGIYNIVIDHVSVSWAVDGNVDLWYGGVHDVTITNSIISEALHNSLHPKGPHSTGMLTGSDNDEVPSRISVLYSLFAHNHSRNPQYSGASNSSIVFANNLIYNWGQYGTRLRYGGDASVVGNVYVSGANSVNGSGNAFYVLDASGFQVYLDDIMVDGSVPSDSWDIVSGSNNPRVDSPPILIDGYSPMNSALVEDYVLNNAGARPADRDTVDTRVVQSVRDRSGRIIDSQSDVGGWPVLAENHRTLVIPDNPNGDDDGDGYTNLEEWLHDYASQVEQRTESLSKVLDELLFIPIVSRK